MDTIKAVRKKDNKSLKPTTQQIKGLQEHLFEIIALYNLSKNLNISLEMERIFTEAEKFMRDSLEIDNCSLLLLDDEGKTLTLWEADSATSEATKKVSFKTGEGITGLAAQTGKPILVKDISKDSRYLLKKWKKTDVGSFYSVPLINKNKKVIGVFNVHSKKINGFKKNRLTLFNEVALQISLALEKSIIFKETRKLAITDDLTQLHSRKYFMDFLDMEISKSERNHSIFSLIMIDVDHFKSVNDNYGHPAGDRILKKLSALLKSITRKEDITARFGGEEFIILLPGTNEKNAITIAEKIRLQAEKSLIIRQKNRSPKKVTVSAGVSSFSETMKTGTGLLASVDQYLYLAKNTGRNRVCSTIHDELQENVDEKRRNQRCPVSLKCCNGNNFIQFIELSVNKQWKICVLDNLSKSGFKGSIEFEMPENQNKVDFRVFSGHEAISNDRYKGVVAFNNRITNGRYSIGVKITDKPKKWENLFSRISV